MATDSILKDAGTICSKLFNHRAALNQEIQLFVKEFETRRGDTDKLALENAQKMTDEMNVQHMASVKESARLLEVCIKEVVETTTACQIVITEGESQLQKTLSPDDLNTLAFGLQQYSDKIAQQREESDAENKVKQEELKGKILAIEDEKRRLLGKFDQVTAAPVNAGDQK